MASGTARAREPPVDAWHGSRRTRACGPEQTAGWCSSLRTADSRTSCGLCPKDWTGSVWLAEEAGSEAGILVPCYTCEMVLEY